MVGSCFLNAYELHAASPDVCQIAMTRMYYSLSSAVCICFASTDTLDTVGFLDTVPISSSDCCAMLACCMLKTLILTVLLGVGMCCPTLSPSAASGRETGSGRLHLAVGSSATVQCGAQ